MIFLPTKHDHKMKQCCSTISQNSQLSFISYRSVPVDEVKERLDIVQEILKLKFTTPIGAARQSIFQFSDHSTRDFEF